MSLTRLTRLADELDAAGPTAFVETRPLADGAVLGNSFLDEPRVQSLELRRLRRLELPDGPPLYRIGPSFFEHLPITMNGRPLDQVAPFTLEPNTAVYVKCTTQWHRTEIVYQQSVIGDPPVRTCTRHYKNGLYTPVSAEIITLAPGEDFTDLTNAPGFSFAFCDFLPEDTPEIQHFLLASTNADGDVVPGGGIYARQIVVRGSFELGLGLC